MASLAILSLQARADAQLFSLGTAQNFAVLGGSTVTNTGPTVITGDLGVSPGSAITGFPPGIVLGTVHAADVVALQAHNDVITSYNVLAGLPQTQDLTGQNLGGLTLLPGVYNFDTSAQLTGTLTLNALGDPNAFFVFQMGSTLDTASSSAVVIINGGDDCNVFWQVGSSATLGTTTSFKGNILADQSITLNTGADIISGRALAINAAVTMDTNDVACEGCRFVDSAPGTFGNAASAAPEPGAVALWLGMGLPLFGLIIHRHPHRGGVASRWHNSRRGKRAS